MTKKKWIVTAVVVVCALVLCVLGVLAVRHYVKNTITFTIDDTLPDGDGKRATVILLAGQSNASGCSLDEYLALSVGEEKHKEYQEGYDNVYINYLSGAHMSQAFVTCATLQGEPEGTFGPELGLAEMLNETYPDETFFIIKCAWGGTNLYEQWRAPSSSGKTGELYRQFIAFVQTSIQYLESKNYDVSIEGLCWMQGESDSFFVETATAYEENLSCFVGDVRKKFARYASEDGIAFVDAYIAALPSYWVDYELVNQNKLAFSQSSSINVLVDTIAEGLTTAGEPVGAPDMAHYDATSEIKLGHLFAKALSPFFDLFE